MFSLFGDNLYFFNIFFMKNKVKFAHQCPKIRWNTVEHLKPGLSQRVILSSMGGVIVHLCSVQQSPRLTAQRPGCLQSSPSVAWPCYSKSHPATDSETPQIVDKILLSTEARSCVGFHDLGTTCTALGRDPRENKDFGPLFTAWSSENFLSLKLKDSRYSPAQFGETPSMW